MHSWIVAGSGGCLKCGHIKTKEKQMFSDKDARALFLEQGFDPQEPYRGANKPWKSLCKKCKQIVSPTYNSIKGGTGCGVCAGKIVVPEIAEEIIFGRQLLDETGLLHLAITDKTYLMYNGSILKEGTPEELAADEMVRKVYLGKDFELKKKKTFKP